MKIEEITNLVEIFKLKFNETYTPETIMTSWYGHLMLMADQDFNRSYISIHSPQTPTTRFRQY